MWSFTDVAEGLNLSDSATSIAKPLLDAASTMASHAFSAVARPMCVSQNRSSSCSVQLEISVQSEQDSVMIGLARPTVRLDTPIPWEDEDVFLVECSTRGAFLWSESLQAFGKPLFPKCLSDKKATLRLQWQSNCFEVAVQGQSSSVLESFGNMTYPAVDIIPQRYVTVHRSAIADEAPPKDERGLVPLVTLISGGCSVRISDS